MMTLCAEEKNRIAYSKQKSNASHRFPSESNNYAKIQTLVESSLSDGKDSDGKRFPAKTDFPSEKAVSDGKNSIGKMTPKKQTAP